MPLRQEGQLGSVLPSSSRQTHSLPSAGWRLPWRSKEPGSVSSIPGPPPTLPHPSLNQCPSHPLPNLLNPPGGPASPRGASCTPLQGNSHHTEPGETVRAGSRVGGGRADPFRRGGEIRLAASRAVLMLLSELSYSAPSPTAQVSPASQDSDSNLLFPTPTLSGSVYPAGSADILSK